MRSQDEMATKYKYIDWTRLGTEKMDVKFVQVEFETEFIDLLDIKLLLQDLDQILEVWGREQQNNTTGIMDPLQILLD